MSDKPKVEVLPIEQGATPDAANLNKHSQRGGGLLENELRKRGAFRSIASAGKGVDVPVVYAGNFTLEKAIDAGYTEIINVHTNGRQLVNVVRDDLAPGTAEAIALGITDNEIGRISYNPDVDILAAVMADPAMQTLKNEDSMLSDIVEGMNVGIAHNGGDKSGSSPWERMSGDSKEGVLLTFGDVCVRLSISVYESFMAKVDVSDLQRSVSRIFGNEVFDN